QQDWAYGATMRLLGVPVLRALIEQDGSPVGLAQFIVRGFGPLASLSLCSRGPLWLQDLTAADKAGACRALRQSLPRSGLKWVLTTPEEGRQHSEHGLPPWRRVVSGYATVLIDLEQQADQLRAALDGKWRNRLVAAEASELQVHRIGTNPGQYRWLLDQEEAQRQTKGLAGLPLGFYEPYIGSRQQPAQCVLSLRADIGRERVAAMMFLIHGQAATYQVGWSNEQGRDLNAHNLLLWRAMLELQSRGVRQLDLGGVNTVRSAGLARFKIGTGGQVLQLAGTYLA
ncbi:MAG: GNAT family N-acetyltransferase, partial [Betaproteobacteria bacterium]